MSKCSIFLLRNLDINTVSRALDYARNDKGKIYLKIFWANMVR